MASQNLLSYFGKIAKILKITFSFLFESTFKSVKSAGQLWNEK